MTNLNTLVTATATEVNTPESGNFLTLYVTESGSALNPNRISIANFTAYLGGQIGGGGGGGAPNQSAFSNIAVSGQTTVAADQETDTLTLVAGTGISITTDAVNDVVTITATGGAGATALDDLTDVNTGTPVDATAYSLTWDAANSRYNLAAITGGGGGASALNDLTDVTITSPADGNFLVRVGGVFVNQPLLSTPRSYTAQQQQAQVVVSYAATFAMDCNTQANSKIVLTGDITLAAPTNAVAGGNYIINLTQDATGGRTITVPADPFAPEGNVALTFDTAANAVNLLSLHCVSTSPLKFIASLLTGRP